MSDFASSIGIGTLYALSSPEEITSPVRKKKKFYSRPPGTATKIRAKRKAERQNKKRNRN